MSGGITGWLRELFSIVRNQPDTSGPAEDEHPIVPPETHGQAVASLHAGFSNGIYDLASPKPANPGRVGGAIRPSTIVVHTTDMVGREEDLIKAWQTTVTSGACAHFLIHRDGTITQFVPITRNANHAGGPVHGHGNYATPTGALVHPNVVAVGIEIQGGGLLKWNGKDWIHTDSKRVIPLSDVYVDEKHRGWQVITPAQLTKLRVLLDDLFTYMGTPVAQNALKIVPDGKYTDNGVAYYADLVTGRLCGHVTLDPVNKTDPGPQVMHWLKDNYGVV